MNEKKRIERVKKSKLIPKDIVKLYESSLLEALKEKSLADKETIKANPITEDNNDSNKKGGGKANSLLLFITQRTD